MPISAPLLATKLTVPPPRPALVARPRLMARLADGLARPVTLISAPAGFGKTTVVAEWLHDSAGEKGSRGAEEQGMLSSAPLPPCSPAQTAWLSLDEGDNDPVRFFAYLIAALQNLDPALGQAAQALLMAQPPPPIETLVATLVNDLTGRAAATALVLDDYHLIHSDAVHQALRFLVEHQPPNLHLILVSREDPPLPFSRLRVRDQIVELREADLRFTPEEAAAFLTRTMGLSLAPTAIADLAERTEGWIAALQIAGLSLQNRRDAEAYIAAFRGDDRYVMDYLMDEVFDRQPPEIQDFLLQTSILETLCGSLCDALLWKRAEEQGSRGAGEKRNARVASPLPPCAPAPPAQAILEHLDRANLFLVPLDNRREWYRYHRLFADLLRYRLQRSYPERLPELHRRACRWYAEAGDSDEAMRHALAIPDPTLAADLAERYLLHLIGSSRIVTYLGWIQRLPAEIVRGRAYLAAGCGWATVLVNQPEAALSYVNSGEIALPHYEPVVSAPEGRQITRAEVAGNLAAIRSYADRLRGDLTGAVEHARQALAALPAEADAIRCAVALNLGLLHLDDGELEPARQALYEAFEAARRSHTNAYAAVSALSQLGGIAAMQGKLREAEGFFQRAVRYGADEAGVAASAPGVGIAHGWLMWLHTQRNELPAAQEHLDRVLEAAGQMGAPATTARATIYQALLAQRRGELDAATVWYAQAEELLRAHPSGGLIQTEWTAFRGQLHLLQGDSAAAAGLLAAQGLKPGDLEEQPTRWLRPRLAGYVLLARVLAARGASQQADGLLERVSALAERIPNTEALLEALALHATLHGDTSRGLASLARALNLAAAEGFVAPFLAAGEPLVKLLRRAISDGIQPGFAQHLLAQLAEEERRRAIAGHVPGASEVPAKSRDSGGTSRLIEPLTDRERQVLRLLAAGLSSTEVAEELVISVSTARSYIKSLYGKLDAHSRQETIERGRRFGLL
ncbi:MAG: LuxR C-terminal-related transcriptional regulator [Chloroflexi bacterium]|nr:LuxR C-terminal-related transcriptional regulator [Chloroflexota bacterium]